jgi:NADH dehydrogenase
VGADLSVPGHPGVFVIGDQARFEAQGGPLPGLAPVAMQQGQAAAASILADVRGKPRRPFRYRDKGTMAVIGRGYAVTEIGALRLAGFPAWVIWILVHILYLIGHRNRLMVIINWAWSYLTFKGGSRLITYASWKESDAPRHPAPAPRSPRPEAAPVP